MSVYDRFSNIMDPDYLRQQAGEAVDWLGGTLGIPESGWSERIAGGPTQNTQTNPAYAEEAPVIGPVQGPVYSGPQVNVSGQPIDQPVQQEQPQQQTQSPDDSWQSVYSQVYPGWGQTEAYADWSAKGKPGVQAPGVKSVAELEQEYQNQLTSELEGAYQPAMDVLGQQEGYLRGAQPGALAGIEGQFGQREGEQKGDLLSAQEQLAREEKTFTGQKEDVLASSRRLYEELRQGAKQRFGGSSSAGGAMSELLGREQMVQQGQTQRIFMDNMFQLNQTRAEVDRSYKQNIRQLNLAKDEAIRKSNEEFNTGLLQIATSKAGLMTEKGLRRLDLLTNLRDSVMKAQQTQIEWTQKLDYQKELAEMQYQYDLKTLSASNQYKTPSQPVSAYTVSGDYRYNKQTGEVVPLSQLVGQVSDEDEFDRWSEGV